MRPWIVRSRPPRSGWRCDPNATRGAWAVTIAARWLGRAMAVVQAHELYHVVQLGQGERKALDISDTPIAKAATVAQLGLESQNCAAEIKLRAERRVGELLAQRDKAPPGRRRELGDAMSLIRAHRRCQSWASRI